MLSVAQSAITNDVQQSVDMLAIAMTFAHGIRSKSSLLRQATQSKNLRIGVRKR